jgi:HNH endonuclease/AP2 domain
MPKLTAERLREVLAYDPLTGEFTWLMTRRGSRARIGEKAGWGDGQGYTVMRVDGVSYQAARLAVLYMTGHWPAKLVDHRNLIRNDDRWNNLREATRSQNAANSSDRPSAVHLKGVTWDRRARKYLAKLGINGRTINLGIFRTAEAAHARYCEAAAEHFGEFAHF